MSESISKPDFSTSGLNFSDDLVTLGMIEGVECVWTRNAWNIDCLRCLRRNVPAGRADISECRGTGGNFMLKIRLQPEVKDAQIETTLFFDTPLAAAEAAEAFEWEIIEQGGFKWYRTTHRDDYTVWHAAVGDGDRAQVSCNGGDTYHYHMRREIQTRPGEWYELAAHRHDMGDDSHAITTFAEAAAIAITLPSFLAVLGSRS